jgi:SAM-dependent methyltransferase
VSESVLKRELEQWMSSIDEQWLRFFEEAYFPLYAPFLPSEKTAQEVEDLLRLLRLPSGSAILDLGCGYGRHALPLAQQGYQVTGLDKSGHLLRLAQQSGFDAQRVPVRWMHGDMRDIPFTNEFDAVLCLFSSFGYFEEEEENLRVLYQVQRALKPGGLLLMDLVSQLRLIRHFSPSGITRYKNGLLVLEERHFDLLRSRNNVRVTLLHPDGKQQEYCHSIRLYTPMELGSLCARVGLPVQGYYGGLDGRPLTLESRLVVVGRRAD